jgi:hypothetical protein
MAFAVPHLNGEVLFNVPAIVSLLQNMAIAAKISTCDSCFKISFFSSI